MQRRSSRWIFTSYWPDIPMKEWNPQLNKWKLPAPEKTPVLSSNACSEQAQHCVVFYHHYSDRSVFKKFTLNAWNHTVCILLCLAYFIQLHGWESRYYGCSNSSFISIALTFHWVNASQFIHPFYFGGTFWVVHSFCLLWIMLLWVFSYISFGEHMYQLCWLCT